MNPRLLMINIPYNCSDRELREWVESRGIEPRSIRTVRDLVSGASPAFGYVELSNESAIDAAVTTLNGKKLRNQIIQVKCINSAPGNFLSPRSAVQLSDKENQ